MVKWLLLTCYFTQECGIVKLFRLVSEFECEVALGDMALIDNALLVSWKLKD